MSTGRSYFGPESTADTSNMTEGGCTASMTFGSIEPENLGDDSAGAELAMFSTSSLLASDQDSYRFTSPFPMTWADVAAGRRSPAVFTPRGLQETPENTPQYMSESLPPLSSLPDSIEGYMTRFETNSEPDASIITETNQKSATASQENVTRSPSKGRGRSNPRNFRGNDRSRTQQFRQSWYRPIHRQQYYQDEYYMHQQQYKSNRFPIVSSQYQHEKYQPYQVPKPSKVFRQNRRQYSEQQQQQERKKQQGEQHQQERSAQYSSQLESEHKEKVQKVEEQHPPSRRNIDATENLTPRHTEETKTPSVSRTPTKSASDTEKNVVHRTSKRVEQRRPQRDQMYQQQTSRPRQHRPSQQGQQTQTTNQQSLPTHPSQPKIKQTFKEQQYSTKNYYKSQNFDNESKYTSRRPEYSSFESNTQDTSVKKSPKQPSRQRTSSTLEHDKSPKKQSKPMYPKKDKTVAKTYKVIASKAAPRKVEKTISLTSGRKLESVDNSNAPQRETNPNITPLLYDGKKSYADILKGQMALLATLNQSPEKQEQMNILASQLQRALSGSDPIDQQSCTSIQDSSYQQKSSIEPLSIGSELSLNEYTPRSEYTETSFVKYIPDMITSHSTPSTDVDVYNVTELVNLGQVAPCDLKQLETMPPLSSFLELTSYVPNEEILTTTTSEVIYPSATLESVPVSNIIEISQQTSSCSIKNYSNIGTILDQHITDQDQYSVSLESRKRDCVDSSDNTFRNESCANARNLDDIHQVTFNKCENEIIQGNNECAYKPKYEPSDLQYKEIHTETNVEMQDILSTLNAHQSENLYISPNVVHTDISKYSYAQILAMNLEKKMRLSTIESKEACESEQQIDISDVKPQSSDSVKDNVRSRTTKRSLQEPEINVTLPVDLGNDEENDSKKSKKDTDMIQGYSAAGVCIPGLLFREEQRSRSTSHRRKTIPQEKENKKTEKLAEETISNKSDKTEVHDTSLRSLQEAVIENTFSERSTKTDTKIAKVWSQNERTHHCMNIASKVTSKYEPKNIAQEEPVIENKKETECDRERLPQKKNEEEIGKKKKKKSKPKVKEDDLEKALKEIADMENSGKLEKQIGDQPSIVGNEKRNVRYGKNKTGRKVISETQSFEDNVEVNQKVSPKIAKSTEMEANEELKDSNFTREQLLHNVEETKTNKKSKLASKCNENFIENRTSESLSASSELQSSNDLHEKSILHPININLTMKTIDLELESNLSSICDPVSSLNHRNDEKINRSADNTSNSSELSKIIPVASAKSAQSTEVTEDNEMNNPEVIEASIRIATEASKPFNLPLPDHASDWMEVIEQGGFSLSSDEEDIMPKSTDVTSEQSVSETKANLKSSRIAETEEIKLAKDSTTTMTSTENVMCSTVADEEKHISVEDNSLASNSASYNQTIMDISKSTIIRKTVIKKVIYIDGIPVETDEVESSEDAEVEAKHDKISATKILKRTNEKIIFIDGKSCKKDEEYSEVALNKEKLSSSAQISQESAHRNVQTKQLLEKVEDIHKLPGNDSDEPSEMTLKGHVEYMEEVSPDEVLVKDTEKTTRKVIKKIVYIEGEPVETEEVLKDPIDETQESSNDACDQKVPDVIAEEVPLKDRLVRALSEPGKNKNNEQDGYSDPGLNSKIKKKLSFSLPGDSENDNKNVVGDNSGDVNIVSSQNEYEINSQTFTETSTTKLVHTMRTIRRIVKTIIYIDGMPVETEQEVELPIDEEGNEIIHLDDQHERELTLNNTSPTTAQESSDSMNETGEPKKKVSFKLDEPFDVNNIEMFTEVGSNEASNKPDNTQPISDTGIALKDLDHAKDSKEKVATIEIALICNDKELPVKTTKDTEKGAQDNVLEERPRFNLKIPDHGNDWMDIITEGGFSLDSDSEDASSVTNDNKAETVVSSCPNDVVEQKAPQAFSLTIPEHANDWMDLMKEEIAWDDSDDEVQPELSVEVNETKEKPDHKSQESTTTEIEKVTNTNDSFKLVVPAHADDWMRLMEDGGFSLSDEEEEEQSQEETKSKDVCSTKENIECNELNLSVRSISNEQVKQFTTNEVTQTKPCFNLPIPDHADDWMTMMEEGFSIEDDDEDETLVDKDSAPLATSSEKVQEQSVEITANDSQLHGKSGINLVHDEKLESNDVSEVKSRKQEDNNDEANLNAKCEVNVLVENLDNKSNEQISFNLPIPEHANDWMNMMEAGEFSLDDDDEIKSEVDFSESSKVSKDVIIKSNEATVILKTQVLKFDKADSTNNTTLPEMIVKTPTASVEIKSTENTPIISQADKQNEIISLTPQWLRQKPVSCAKTTVAENTMTQTIKSSFEERKQMFSKTEIHDLGKQIVSDLTLATSTDKQTKLESVVHSSDNRESLPKIESAEVTAEVPIANVNNPSGGSYANMLFTGKPKQVEEPITEGKRLYKRRNPDALVQIDTEIHEKNVTETDEDGFTQVVSKKEKRRAKLEDNRKVNDHIENIDTNVTSISDNCEVSVSEIQADVESTIDVIVLNESIQDTIDETHTGETISETLDDDRQDTCDIFDDNEFPSISINEHDQKLSECEIAPLDETMLDSYAKIVLTGETINDDNETTEIKSVPYIRRNPPIKLDEKSEETTETSTDTTDKDGFQEIKSYGMRKRGTLSQSTSNEDSENFSSPLSQSMKNIYIPDITSFQHPNRFAMDKKFSESEATNIPQFSDDLILEDFYEESNNETLETNKAVKFADDTDKSLVRISVEKINETVTNLSVSDENTVASEENIPCSIALDNSPCTAGSYAGILIKGAPVPIVDEPAEERKPYKHRNPPHMDQQPRADLENVSLQNIDTDGFIEVLSKRERQRRRTCSSSNMSKELEEDILQASQSVQKSPENINQENDNTSQAPHMKEELSSVSSESIIKSSDETPGNETEAQNAEASEKKVNIEVEDVQCVQIESQIPQYDITAMNEAETRYHEYISRSKLETFDELVHDTVNVTSTNELFEELQSVENEKVITASPIEVIENDDTSKYQLMLDDCSTYCFYDLYAMQKAENLYYEYCSAHDVKDSWANIVSKPKPETPHIEEPDNSQSFILLKKKYVQVVVREEDEKPIKPQVEKVDDEGFTEYITKRERRRRLLSACSNASDYYDESNQDDECIKDVVAYVSPIELPNLDHLPNLSAKIPVEPEVSDINSAMQNNFELEDDYEESQEETPKKRTKRTSHKRSHKSSKISEAEQEVDEIIRKINEEHPKNVPVDDVQEDVWQDKWKFENAEIIYHEMLEKENVSNDDVNSNVSKSGDKDDDNDSDDGGDWDSAKQPKYSSPAPPSPSNRDSDSKSVVQNRGSKQPQNWSDESTYLSLSPIENPLLSSISNSDLPSCNLSSVANYSDLYSTPLCNYNQNNLSSCKQLTNLSSSPLIENSSSISISSSTATIRLDQTTNRCLDSTSNYATDISRTCDVGKVNGTVLDVTLDDPLLKSQSSLAKVEKTINYDLNHVTHQPASCIREEGSKVVFTEATQHKRIFNCETISHHKTATKSEATQVRCFFLIYSLVHQLKICS